jgi:hypothetical protein
LVLVKAVSAAVDAAGVGGDVADSMKRTVFGFLGPVPSGLMERSAARRAVTAVFDRLHDGFDSVGHRGAALTAAETILEKSQLDYEKKGTDARTFLANVEAVTKAKRAYKLAFEMSQKVEALLTRCDGA